MMRATWSYGGCTIGKMHLSGMYEAYVCGRFVRADTLTGIKTLIREAKAAQS